MEIIPLSYGLHALGVRVFRLRAWAFYLAALVQNHECIKSILGISKCTLDATFQIKVLPASHPYIHAICAFVMGLVPCPCLNQVLVNTQLSQSNGMKTPTTWPSLLDNK